jgi:hypothetical protein
VDNNIAPPTIAIQVEIGRVLLPVRSQVPLLQHLEQGFAVPSRSAGDRQKPTLFYRQLTGWKSIKHGSPNVLKSLQMSGFLSK